MLLLLMTQHTDAKRINGGTHSRLNRTFVLGNCTTLLNLPKSNLWIAPMLHHRVMVSTFYLHLSLG